VTDGRPGVGNRLPSFSIIVETENLANAELDGLSRCLATLADQDVSPSQANEVLLVDSGDVPAELLARLRAEYPWIGVHRAGTGTGYYEAKMEGVARVTGEVVLFCDSDCAYGSGWLEAMLAPFARNADVQVVAGETSMAIDGPYSLAMALTYIFPPFSRDDRLRGASSYFCNNVAFRREFLLRRPLPGGLPVYRGNCVVHARALRRSGETIWRQPRARATHAPPDGPRELFWRFLLLGDDALALTRLSISRPQRPSHAADRLREALSCLRISAGKSAGALLRVGPVLAEDPRRLAHLPAALPVAAASLLLFQAGLVAGYLRPNALLSAYDRIAADADALNRAQPERSASPAPTSAR
jgi:hypothetical protein